MASGLPATEAVCCAGDSMSILRDNGLLPGLS